MHSLLVFKFETVGAEYEARLQAATPAAIDRYLQRLLTADSLAARVEQRTAVAKVAARLAV